MGRFLKFAVVLVVGVVVSAAQPASALSVLVNGGAEMGDLTGWQNDNSGAGGDNSWKVSPGSASSSGCIWAYEGHYLFDLGCGYRSGDVMRLLQRGTAGLDAPQLRLTGWFANESVFGNPPDSGEAVLRIYADSAENQLLAHGSTGVMSDLPNLTWHWFSASVDVKGLSAQPDHWRVDLIAYMNYGTCLDVVFDGLALTPVPEPSTISLALLGVGFCTLSAARRRKKDKANCAE